MNDAHDTGSGAAQWDKVRHAMHRRGSGVVEVRSAGRRVDAWTLSQVLAATVAAAGAGDERADALLPGLFAGLETHRTPVGWAGVPRKPWHPDHVYYDDNAWLGHAAVGAALLHASTDPDRAGSELLLARAALRTVRSGEQPGGGVLWRRGGDTRNACSTAPAGILALRVVEAGRALAGREPGDAALVDFAVRCARFLDSLVDHDGLVGDHARRDGSVEPSVHSYNQGTAIGLQLQLARTAGDRGALGRAVAFAEAAWRRYAPGGESSALWREAPAFAGLLARNLLALSAIEADQRWPALAADWAAAVARSGVGRSGWLTAGGIGRYDTHHRLLDLAAVVAVQHALAWPRAARALLV